VQDVQLVVFQTKKWQKNAKVLQRSFKE